MNTLEYIFNKYKLYGLVSDNYVEIPDVGRNDLAILPRELGFKKLVEVGVQRGIYSEILVNENPQATIFGVDSWKAYVTHPNKEYLKTTQNHSSQEMLDKFYEQTKIRMSSCKNYVIIKEYSIDALKYFEDESLDFVYIDANHEYKHVMFDIVEWSKKVKKGGIVSGHDYYKVKNPDSLMHVKFAVNDYVRVNKISPLIIWGANNAKVKATFRDRRRSWSWIIN